MVHSKLDGIMTLCTIDFLLIDMKIVMPGVKAVILRGAVDVAQGTLSVHIDGTREPVRCWLAAMTADIGAGQT